MSESDNEDVPTDYAQLMLMMDADTPEDCFRGAFLLVAQGDSKSWRWYDAELSDDLDHMKRFICTLLTKDYSIGEYMMMLCSVEQSGMVDAVDIESN